MRVALVALLWLLTGSAARAQQVADTAYRYANPRPAFPRDSGPTVCIDGGHRNFHTIDGRYAPFADLLRSDGFRPRGVTDSLSASTLAGCGILVVANPLAEDDRDPALVPRHSAFSPAETAAIIAWVRDGGALLLILDHAPYPAAARDLSLSFGVLSINGFAGPAPAAPAFAVPFGDPRLVPESTWAAFGASAGFTPERLAPMLSRPGTLGQHAILSGRAPDEAVRLVVTFTGHGFRTAEGVTPLLVWGAEAVSAVAMPRGFDPALWPLFAIGGWAQGAARRFGAGRVVVLGEAAMCTAQVAGGRLRAGINAAVAPHNAQFCLNAVRWLAGAIAD